MFRIFYLYIFKIFIADDVQKQEQDEAQAAHFSKQS